MAATLGTIQTDVVGDRSHMGEKVRVLPVSGVADTDTIDTGIDGITRVAWEASAITHHVAITYSGSTLTFGTSGVTTHAGNIIIWSRT